jgi:hypothetical protein
MYCHHFLLSFLPFFVYSTAQALIGYTAMAQGRWCELKVAGRATALAPIGPWGGGGSGFKSCMWEDLEGSQKQLGAR